MNATLLAEVLFNSTGMLSIVMSFGVLEDWGNDIAMNSDVNPRRICIGKSQIVFTSQMTVVYKCQGQKDKETI